MDGKWNLKLLAIGAALLSTVSLLPASLCCAQRESSLPDTPKPVAQMESAPSPAAFEAFPPPAIDESQPGTDPGVPSWAAGFAAPESDADMAYEPVNESIPRGGAIDLTPLFRVMSRPANVDRGDASDPASQRYNVRMMLWESLAFMASEDAFRFLTDANLRRLTADKPYWHDYFASMGQWNMRRWWDGDDFLVDDIGHPMQGGVASFIEIQNSPRQRDLRLSNSKEYWRSRFLGMMWATVFSTQQKIGPLGEAALGSDGGITYPLNCEFPCTKYVPGVTRYTNNTGWTDFIITPVVGSVWVVLEDFIDLHVSDRLQDRYGNRLWVNIVRGAVNPCRTMANAMRWRMPSYRDFQEDGSNLHITRPMHFLPADDEVVRTLPRFEIFPHFNLISLPVNTASCLHCRQLVAGSGVGFAVRLSKWFDADSDVDYQPNASPLPSDRAGGNATLGTFGFRSGFQNDHFSVKAAVRPGFLSYDRAYESTPSSSNPTPSIGRITHFAAALAINGDYNVARHLALRGVFGNTAVRYRGPNLSAPTPGKPPYLNWLSRENFLTNENWAYQAGAVLRF